MPALQFVLLTGQVFFKSDLIGPQFLLPPTPAAHFIYTTGSGLPVLKAVLHHSLAKAFKVDINGSHDMAQCGATPQT